MSHTCPLCRHSAAQQYYRDQFRSYYQCANCALVFVPREYFLSPEEERAYYDLHENSLVDGGYRRFLSRCAEPLLKLLPPNSRGMDFGCGPAPLLAEMLCEAGHAVDTYDIFYADNWQILEQEFDFIVATEVVEHLHSPGEVLAGLWKQLRAGGVMALMTKLVISPERFASWHYIRDPTHICFFSGRTFLWLAQQMSAGVEFSDSDVILLFKSGIHPK